MTPNGNVKLTDFGIARSQDTSTITDSGSITGTATYLSPEQASGEKATETSDLYSLGVVIYSCLSGKVPFDRDGPVAIALAHLKDPPPPLPDQIPGPVSDLVMSLLEKRPDDRPIDADAVRAQAALLRKNDPATPVPPVATGPTHLATAAASPAVADPTEVGPTVSEEVAEEGEEPPRRNRRKLFLIIGAAAAALALVAAYLIFGRGGEPVTMPDVVGMSQPDAEAKLKDLKIDADIDVKDVPKVEAGEVVGQSEDAGTTVETGSTVILTVASGSVSLPGEEIIGSTYREARAQLEELGLTAQRVTKQSDSDPGIVIDIDETSWRVDVGSTVTLVVAVPRVTEDPTFAPTPQPTKNPTPKPKPTKTTPPPDPDADADGNTDADVDADGNTDTDVDADTDTG
jgi:eukaryotic-like serine/threonine-protein kinase